MRPFADTTSKDPEENSTSNTASEPTTTVRSNIRDEPAWLTRNYYGTPWMTGATIVAEAQIVFLTLAVFAGLRPSNTGTLKIFLTYIGWFFVTQPLCTYCYILLGIIYEGSETEGTPRTLVQALWVRLPRPYQKLHPTRHYFLYPGIFLLISCITASYAGEIMAFMPGIMGLGWCFCIMVFRVNAVLHTP